MNRHENRLHANFENLKLHGPTEDLVGLMQLTHGALVLAFGRVGADQIVGRALTEAAKLPEALRYAPRLLMGA